MSFLNVAGICKTFGLYHALQNVNFTVERGQVATLLGPSGCGKTTMLRAIAGLVPIDSGRVELDGRVLANGGLHVSPERRGIGMVFQSYALWPHKTIRANIALGLKLKKMHPAEITAKIQEVLAIVGLAGVEDRYPGSLSGGQQQRIALARALALEPSCLLFDEPLSNLDVILRERMRFEIREILVRTGITAVYVTHDQSEAMVISDLVLIMNGGKIVQIGSPREVYLRPASRFVAEFLGGANLIPLDAARSDSSNGIYAASPEICLRGRAEETLPPVGLIAFRPENVTVADADGASGPNELNAVVESTAFLGSSTQCRARIGAFSINVAIPGWRDLAAGQSVRLRIDPDSITVVAESTGVAS